MFVPRHERVTLTTRDGTCPVRIASLLAITVPSCLSFFGDTFGNKNKRKEGTTLRCYRGIVIKLKRARGNIFKMSTNLRTCARENEITSLTIILRGRAGYQMIDNQRGAELVIII